MKKILFSLVVAFVGIFTLASSAFAATSVIYNALPSVDPATSYPSQPFQAQQVYEFGDLIHLGGTDRVLNSITVTMSDYALYSTYSSDSRYMDNQVSWTHPITLNVYNVVTGTPNTVGTLLGSVTQAITIPWRPVGDDTCPLAYGTDHQWRDSTDRCNYGYAFNATFDLSGLNLTLPEDIIVSVAFNTQSYGVTPMGVDGPYNSLNVAVPDNQAVIVGSNDPNSVFLSSTWAGAFVNGSLAGTGFVEDTGWTPNGTVAMRVTTTSPFVRSAVITSPLAGEEVSGTVSFDATLTDEGEDDSVQWAVRKGTCAAATGTVLGNVDGFSSAYEWDHVTFHASADTSSWIPGGYCFVFNPSESAGDTAIRETREFSIKDTTAPSVPTNLGWINKAGDPVACGSTITDLVAGAVKADWDDSTDNVGVDHYEYVSFNPPEGWAWPSLDSGYVVTNSEYGDTNYTPSVGTYGFMVRAVDAAGNKSDWTDTSKTIVGSCQITFSNPPVLVGPPTNKDQCKKDGWKTFNNPTFKNQGECVSYVQSNDHAGKRN